MMPIRAMRPSMWPMVALILTAGGCDGTVSSAPLETPAPASPAPPTSENAISLRMLAGDGQTGEPEQHLDNPLVLQLVDERQQPVAGVPIRFLVQSGGGVVTDSILVSDAGGRVRQRSWTLGLDTSAAQRLIARAGTGAVTFAAQLAAPTRNTTAMNVLVIVDSTVFEHRAGADRAVRIMALAGPGGDARLSPDGRDIAFGRGTAPSVCLTPIDGGPTRCASHPAATRLFVEDWLEDNRNVLLRVVLDSCTSPLCKTTSAPLLLDRSTMLLASPPDGAPSPAVFGGGVSTSSDDGTRAWVERGNVVLSNADGSGVRSITGTLDAAYDAYSVSWSPDGRRLGVVLDSLAHCPMGCAQVLGVMEPDGSRLRVLQGRWNEYNLYKWSPDGAFILYSGHQCGPERCTAGPVHAMSMDGIRVTVAARGRLLGVRRP